MCRELTANSDWKCGASWSLKLISEDPYCLLGLLVMQVFLCQFVKSSVVGVTDRSLLNQVSESGSQCASSYRELLQQIHVVSGIFLSEPRVGSVAVGMGPAPFPGHRS